jgi:hypothetical protein
MAMERNNEVKNSAEGQNIHSVSIMRRYSKADFICFAISTTFYIAAACIPNYYVKCVCILLAMCSLVAPAIILRIRERNSFSLAYVHKVLAEAGLNPIVVDEELHCTYNGKDTTIKVHNGAMLQLTREYQISTKNDLDKYIKAAAATTREVCSVKVGIRRDGEDMGALVFCAESFCPSAKVFRQLFSGYLQALDVAEQRQGDNLRDVLSRDDKPRRKIGFITNHSN